MGILGGGIRMSALMGLAIDTMFGSIADRFRSMLLNLIMTVISWLEQLGIAFFDSAFVSQTLTFTKGISWLVLGLPPGTGCGVYHDLYKFY